MNIACCGIDREQFHAAEQACGCPVLYFVDASDRRGDVRLAYALRDGVPIRLAVVGYQGAAGLTACDFLCSHLPGERILWLCRRPEFSTEARRSAYTSIPWDRPIPSHPIKLHRSSSACCGSSQNTIKEA